MRQDGSTEAVIEVSDTTQQAFGGVAQNPVSVLAQSAIQTAIASLGYNPDKEIDRLVNTVEFSYSSDVTQLGDPFTVSVPDPRGRYVGKFRKGQTIRLYLQNPNVDGNARTLKAIGLIVNRRVRTNRDGTVIQLDCADLGWHLTHTDAPLWYRLSNLPNINEAVTLYDLLTNPDWVDPSWGFRGISADNETNRLLKQRLNAGRVQREIDLRQALGVLTWIQVEPGVKIADYLTQYSRRQGRLVNVSVDGYIQVWTPDYAREPLFSIDLRDLNDPARTRNNVIEADIQDSIEGVYTDVTCVGEQIGLDITQQNLADQNYTKFRGRFQNQFVIPFARRATFSEGDIYDEETGKKQALWFYQRGLFDSWSATYKVRGHWQKPHGSTRSYWWESDQMCAVNDSVHGLSGNFYVSAVRCDRNAQDGDVTFVTLRLPCLRASFGPFPDAPIQRSVPVDGYAAKQTTETASEITVTEPQKSQ